MIALWTAATANAQDGASYTNEDPGAPGPLAVTKQEYDLGDTAYHPPSLPVGRDVEVRGSVHRPTNLSGGPYPLVVMLHGHHPTCYDTETNDPFAGWPCTGNRQPIPSYAGYDYLAQQLASHGMIVISISANGVNSATGLATDGGVNARAELIGHQLALWKSWNEVATGPFGATFAGKLDLTRIGLLGHSRGGEGIVRYHVLNSAIQNSPFTIRALLGLAPTADNDVAAGNVPNNVPLGIVLGYCDGDIRTLEGVYYYDRTRYSAPGDTSAKQLMIAMGANHNFFNTVWTPGLFPAGTIDDWSDIVTGEEGNLHCKTPGVGRRLTAAQQRNLAIAYLAAFFRSFLSNQMRFLPILTGDAPMPPSAGTSDVLLAYLAPDDSSEPARRLDVNRYTSVDHLSSNDLVDAGGQRAAVTHGGLAVYEICPVEGNSQCITQAGTHTQQPHTYLGLAAVGVPTLKQMRVKWNAPGAFVENSLPVGRRDLTRWRALQFRTALDWSLGPQGASGPLEIPQNFSVRLTDGSNNSATVRVGDFSSALAYPPGRRLLMLPKLLVTSVTIPVQSFGIVSRSVDALK
jgi:hypothetical protein